MLYTVTIVDDRNNQKLRGQDWVDITDLFECSDHMPELDPQCAACVRYDEILDALAHNGEYHASGVEYSEYYGADALWSTSIVKEV